MAWIRVGKREHIGQWLLMLLNLVALGLLVAFFAHYYPHRTRISTLVYNGSGGGSGTFACDDDRVIDAGACARTCRSPYRLSALNVCLNTVAPGGTPCVDKCYVDNATSTVCDAHGACSGTNVAECRGYCQTAADCEAAVPLNPFWLTANATLDNAPIMVDYRHVCYYNKCELFVLDRFWQAEVANYGTAIGGYNRCDDYLNSDFVQARGDCLTQERFLLDRNLTNPAFYPPAFNATPSQFSMCMFYYDCAPINQTAILKREAAVMVSTIGAHNYHRVQAMAKELGVSRQ